MRLRERWPEYEQDARFRCGQGCGTRMRCECAEFRGRLVCPRCRYIGTLVYVPAAEESKG